MTNNQYRFEIQIAGENYTPNKIDTTTRQLRQELIDVGVEIVKLKNSINEQPSGTKSVDPVMLGAILVTLGPTMLTKFLDFLHAWSLRREGRIVKLKFQTKTGELIELEVPATMEQGVVKQWIKMVQESVEDHPKNKKKN